MVVYLVIIFILIIWKSKYYITCINREYISKESSYAVKGIFILLILASHFSQYIPEYSKYVDLLYWNVRMYLGQLVVTMFLFYSGYGVLKSSISKGIKYIHSFPKKRILSTLFVYDLSQLIFFSMQVLLGKHYTTKDYFLSMVAWKSFGNDNWYIFAIVNLYIISWITFVIYKDPKRQVLLISICTIGFIQFMMLTGKGSHWYNTLICFPAGAVYSLQEEKIVSILKKNSVYFFFFLITIIVFIFLHKYWKKSVIIYGLVSLLFVMIILLITLKMQVRNKLLIYCGKHLQGLFLIHKIPMALLKELGVISKNIYFSFSVCVIVTFGLEYLFNKAILSLKDNKIE